jgi:hypothetical protein
MAKDPITGEPLSKVSTSDLKTATKRATTAAKKAPAKKTAPTTKAAAKEEGKQFVPPKNLAACADAYYTKREERLALERKAALVGAEENACREYLINNLPKSQASGISGKVARVAVENKDVYTVKDWDGVWGYIIKNVKKMPGLTGMLQRRINESMVKEMAEAGKLIPGVEKIEVPVVRLNKL